MDPHTTPDRHLDALETRSPEERERQTMAALSAQIAHAQSRSHGWARDLAGVEAARIDSRAALATLPVLRKHDLLQRQRERGGADPFGGYSVLGWGPRSAAHRARRVFASPGPIHEPEGAQADYWRMARALCAAGLREGDLAHNTFSHHFTPAGAMMESGAFALGCTVFPAGTGQTELQVHAMAALRPSAYLGTPSFLRIILERADELGVAVPSLVKAAVSGEAFPASLRDWLQSRGIAAYQSYGTADLGLIAYETRARAGLVVDEGVIVEIVRPGGTQVLPEGEVGEVVVTTLNPGYPLIRFGTGDLSAVLPGACPSGRTNMRIKGWMGRADQTAKVRGMFVHPEQVAQFMRKHPEVQRARLVISGESARDQMTLHVEVDQAPPGMAEQLAQSLREVTKLRGEVRLCAPHSLPNDGKVIDDVRTHE